MVATAQHLYTFLVIILFTCTRLVILLLPWPPPEASLPINCRLTGEYFRPILRVQYGRGWLGLEQEGAPSWLELGLDLLSKSNLRFESLNNRPI